MVLLGIITLGGLRQWEVTSAELKKGSSQSYWSENSSKKISNGGT